MNITAQTKYISTKLGVFAHNKAVLAATGGLLIVATSLMITNPGQSAYVDYASERLSEEFKQDCNELNESITFGAILELPTKDLCKSFVGSADLVGRGTVKFIVENSTRRKNFAVFSIYTTKIPGRTFKTAAIGRNFIMFYSR